MRVAAVAVLAAVACLMAAGCQAENVQTARFVKAAVRDDGDAASFARWLVHNTTYGVMATNSRQFSYPFGNIFSFSDGPVNNASGHIYFYASPLDASVHDLQADPRCSLTVTQEDTGTCALDPEDPTCGRLTFMGRVYNVSSAEEPFAKEAMFSRHPEMKNWSPGGSHQFRFMALEIHQLWLVNHYGGAAIIDPADYYAAKPKPPSTKRT
ncbi:hypothetical protein PTSG_03149 [Salpingoeca rosetta]|uniref:CREG-like beta-barrel domain-containing protein n=1 Tax=Salpingoeca rosetta (strain ATCC 50818 / BSB-021) TaxID=946362 RepID=F2U4D5_SALR5|nr:uncharacterized protein PTSG_03149 [Salpingoeca rosetta]EGD82501.1 hypothetical protein PTSG_03149 [Salpingoeca rosetta]|eukprot:XP_004995737.1 hypothetical protein PTSG_03149 [Salpingoeca rosetta]